VNVNQYGLKLLVGCFVLTEVLSIRVMNDHHVCEWISTLPCRHSIRWPTVILDGMAWGLMMMSGVMPSQVNGMSFNTAGHKGFTKDSSSITKDSSSIMKD